MRTLLAALIVAGAFLAGCGGGSSSGDSAPVEGNGQSQAEREFDICMEQADRIGETQGAEAAGQHRDGCVDARWNSPP